MGLPLRSGGAFSPATRTVGLRPPFGGGGRCRHSLGGPRPKLRFRYEGAPAPLLPALVTLGQSGVALRAALFSARACPQNGFFSASKKNRLTLAHKIRVFFRHSHEKTFCLALRRCSCIRADAITPTMSVLALLTPFGCDLPPHIRLPLMPAASL